MHITAHSSTVQHMQVTATVLASQQRKPVSHGVLQLALLMVQQYSHTPVAAKLYAPYASYRVKLMQK
eukprot:10166-Heterococcus_DN1.PRE.2